MGKSYHLSVRYGTDLQIGKFVTEEFQGILLKELEFVNDPQFAKLNSTA